ncbi:MAG: hypothetical protein AAB801_00420 [Patescibacteria group bacterium]
MTPERILRGKTLSGLLNPRFASWAGFKWGEIGQPSSVRREDNLQSDYRLHFGFIQNINDQSGLHLVVGEKITGRKRAWFVQAFEGLPWNSMTSDEAQEYLQKAEDVFRRKNNVPARVLEGGIRMAIESHKRK